MYCYIRSRDPFNINPSFINFLAELVVIDINVSELSIKLSIAFGKELYHLHIITVDYLLLIGVKLDFFKESLPPN